MTIPQVLTLGLTSSWLVAGVYAVLAKVAYDVVLAVYHLYLSPLRHFPRYAPAAATFWYETYWDVFRDHSYVWRIRDMHRQLDSPVIRTNPHDVHIHDPDFFDELYTPSGGGVRPGDKWPWWTRGFAVPTAGGMTIEHEVHRRRRGALNPFFSKASIVANQPIIHDKVAVMCARLATTPADHVLDLEAVFLAVTTDVLTQCSYGWTYDYVHNPDWAMAWKLVNTGGRASAAIVRSFPLVGRVVRAMPLWLAVRLVPPVGFMKSWMLRVAAQVRKLKADADAMAAIRGGADAGKRRRDTIFAQILGSGLPEAELSDERLVDEGVLIATAGSETTAWAVTVTTYHVMRSPAVLARLRAELDSVAAAAAAPGSVVADWTVLERLPYLTAVVKEGTRLAGGMLSRLPRIYSRPLHYRQWVIPAGTPVAMTPHLVLMDDAVFPAPRRFSPDRWLDRGPTATTSRLDRYLVAFGRGSRNCIGMHLAHAQLYMCVAAVCARFDLAMYETDDSDATPTRDLFTAGTRVDSKGIRVTVRARETVVERVIP